MKTYTVYTVITHYKFFFAGALYPLFDYSLSQDIYAAHFDDSY